jgi:hypothetical protein
MKTVRMTRYTAGPSQSSAWRKRSRAPSPPALATQKVFTRLRLASIVHAAPHRRDPLSLKSLLPLPFEHVPLDLSENGTELAPVDP